MNRLHDSVSNVITTHHTKANDNTIPATNLKCAGVMRHSLVETCFRDSLLDIPACKIAEGVQGIFISSSSAMFSNGLKAFVAGLAACERSCHYETSRPCASKLPIGTSGTGDRTTHDSKDFQQSVPSWEGK